MNSKRRLSISLLVVVLSLATVLTALAATITWTGNGTTSGYCQTLVKDTNVPAGSQVWHFVLTSSTSGSVLTYSFSDGTSGSVAAARLTGGASHYFVTTTEGAKLLSASATQGGSRSVLTVSDCTVNPPPLQVSKDANTTFDRTYNWTITKDANPTEHTLLVGGSASSHYIVTLTKSDPIDSNWAVSGTITIYNPSLYSATITSVVDDVSGIAALVNCPSNAVGAGQTMYCSYSASLPDGSARTNTATVTTSGLVGGGSGQADVTFGAPTNVTNDTVNVTDSWAGSLGSFSASGTSEYDRTFTCDSAGETDYPNTATIVETNQSDDANVHVTCQPPPVLYWCSPGYWSNQLDVAATYVDLNTPYSSIGGAPLKNGAPANPTIGNVLSEGPSVYGGEAFNSVANYISGIAFAPNGGTQSSGENCPLNAHGEWVG